MIVATYAPRYDEIVLLADGRELYRFPRSDADDLVAQIDKAAATPATAAIILAAGEDPA